MLGSDKSRGYCLEMICADFLAGAHLDNDNPEILLQSLSRYYKFLPTPQQENFLVRHQPESFMMNRESLVKAPRIKLNSDSYRHLQRKILERDGWRCQICGSMQHLEVHHIQLRSRSGSDVERNLITLCTECHQRMHR